MLYRGLECKYEIWEVKHGNVWSRYKPGGGDSDSEASGASQSQLQLQETVEESVASGIEIPSSADLGANVSMNELERAPSVAQHLEQDDRVNVEHEVCISKDNEEILDSHEAEVSEINSSDEDVDLLIL